MMVAKAATEEKAFSWYMNYKVQRGFRKETLGECWMLGFGGGSFQIMEKSS